MNIIKYLIAFIGVISIFLAGCSNLIENEEQFIQLEKRNDKNKYDDYKIITTKEEVQKVKEILTDINWKKAIVNMAHPADYRFVVQFKKPEIEAKTVLYELWISPNKENIELVIEVANEYVQLNKNNSAELFEILVGEKLSDQK
ncbi:hypothetical protein [Cytobacillus sp. IB215665]|uniref:hypothetical protein n=1 Tax=Cytobacillus sp. IB215665 TaxID=3097357 RepID=UPI002A16D8EE|nr:hypothetical protein [Cytobacillus sp. IB215665]MDX8366177.1 hypothetical protein [Cytobacillus sp. IB215665]